VVVGWVVPYTSVVAVEVPVDSRMSTVPALVLIQKDYKQGDACL